MTFPRSFLLLACSLLPALAAAQASVGVGAVSQYWVRGVPLSAAPAPQVSVDWDGDGGWFAGALLTRARLRYAGAGAAGVAYAGYARKLGEDLSAEGGINAVRFDGAGEYGYHELFAGLSARGVSARIYYAPRYYGVYGSSVYGEVNGSVPLDDNVELTLHAGRLHAGAGKPELYYTPAAQSRTDVRIGVTGMWDGWTLHLSAVAARGDAARYAASTRRTALTAGVLRTF